MSVQYSFSLAATSLTVLLALTACKDPEPEIDTTGTLRVELSADRDGSAIDPVVDEAWVRIDSVQAHHESEGWVELATERLDVNLMDAIDFDLVASDDIWTGAYQRIYIGVVDAWIIVDGVEEDLAFSGNFQPSDPIPSGMYVNESLFVVEDSVTTLQVSWNLADNLSSNSDGDWSLGADATATVDIVE